MECELVLKRLVMECELVLKRLVMECELVLKRLVMECELVLKRRLQTQSQQSYRSVGGPCCTSTSIQPSLDPSSCTTLSSKLTSTTHCSLLQSEAAAIAFLAW
jgi:hypothetical protein